MAKSKEVNKGLKKNIKLRKQIRRTFGVLFMASAIVVAAIPVQGIEAGPKADEIIADDDRGNASYPATTTDVNFGADYPILSIGTNTEYSSDIIRQLSNGSWSLNWQFKYFVQTISGAQRAIISEYNSTYPETTVVLSNSANASYFKVTAAKYNAFYTTGSGTTIYTYSYADYKTSLQGTESAGMMFFKKYRKDSYDIFTALCAAHNKYTTVDHPAWVIDHDAWVAAGSGVEPIEPVEPTIPTSISVTPSNDFTEAEKMKFYCDLAEGLPSTNQDWIPGTGYTLVAVTDNTTAGSGGVATTNYVAKGGTPIAPAYNDANGFLVTTASTEIIGIGDGAFANISNVDYLTIPTEIKYVGNNAFAGSFLKSITMGNVEAIGNRAFKNCSQLTNVTMTGTKMIGTESFYGSGVTSITFPYSVSRIGEGAFAECTSLANVDFSQVSTNCTIDQYAFYNCYALNSVNMINSGIKSIGGGTFAVMSPPTGSWTRIELPAHILETTDPDKGNLGNYLFEGRTNLLSVLMPTDYGSTKNVNMPKGMFRNCRSLEYVEFPDSGSGTCGYVKYDPSMFLDVVNEEFYVKGPEKSVDGNKAQPRQSTWAAVSRASDFIPYVYKNSQGVMCYEVSDGTYILQADETGKLNSCELFDPTDTTTPIDMVVPGKVGTYNITSVAEGCFADNVLKRRIRSITISDDSITTLARGVFADLPNLEKVLIGNSVASIGENAFKNCGKLTEVTFHTPSVGYEGFTIGTDAFKTESGKLVFHGDIVPGYAPFEFAIGEDSGKIDDIGKRICYKSLSPDYLTVMYDKESGEVTLLEYPKYGNLDTQHADYIDGMEKFYYAKFGSVSGLDVNYGSIQYDDDRDMFLKAVTDPSDPNYMSLADAYESHLYGPWIDPIFVSGPGAGISGLEAFYTHQPYSIIGNYERGNQARGEYETVTDSEVRWINGTLNIVVPAGVTSIDSKGFFESTQNRGNITTYFNTSSKDYNMSNQSGTENGTTVTPGLFSGTYADYPAGSGSEKYVKGNDRVLSIIMSTVKSLPDYAFDSCERLQTVVLGAACEDIGIAPFRGCTSMTTVTGNAYYAAENGIVYSKNADGTYTIEECLASRGNIVGNPYIDSSSDPLIASVSAITDGAFEDCDYITKVYLSDATNLKVIPKNCFNDCDKLQSVDLPESVNRIEEAAFGGNESITVLIPGKEVHIVTDAFEHVNTNTIITYKESAAYDYGKYHGLDVVLMEDRYKVDFLDYDGTSLGDAQYVTIGKSAVAPADPVREGYTFTGWSKVYTNVQSNLTIVAQYASNSSDEMKFTVTFYNYDDTVVSTQKIEAGGSAVAPLAPVRSGYVFTGWKPTSFTNVQRDLDIIAQFEREGSTNASASPSGSGSGANSSASPSGTGASTSPSATPTSSPNETTKYTATVSGGSGSGSYAAGTIVTIAAYATGDGKVFDRWTTASTGVGFQDATSATTSFTMPAGNVTVTATYKTGTTASSTSQNVASNGSGGSTGNNTASSNGSSVQITKPGISNTGLAAANVNGSLDNFVVKITEDAAATAAAEAALKKQYGDISNIRYFPMDISLYDSTGRTKITDTAGITVDITLPVPDDLVPYAGNNKMASTAGNTLENLNSKFTTIDGIPCMTFTATHFSPYVLYVDTANLTYGTIDSTPQTGDMIHPKWFLVIGLASISLLMFFKRDRAMPKIKMV